MWLFICHVPGFYGLKTRKVLFVWRQVNNRKWKWIVLYTLTWSCPNFIARYNCQPFSVRHQWKGCRHDEVHEEWWCKVCGSFVTNNRTFDTLLIALHLDNDLGNQKINHRNSRRCIVFPSGGTLNLWSNCSSVTNIYILLCCWRLG